MRTSALGTILGVLALAASALLYLKVDRLETSLTPRVVDRSARASDGGATEGAGPAARHGQGGVTREAEAWGDRGSPQEGTVHRTQDGSAPVARDMVDRVRELEQEVSRLRAERGGGAPVRFSAPRFVSSVDELSRSLELSPTQTDRIRESVDRHRRRIEDVLRIPDETGVSPWERRQQERARMREAIEGANRGKAGGVLQFAMGSLMDQNRKIPGRSTTYGEEVARIKSEAREEIAQGLDSAQQKSFEDVRIDPLLDQGTGSGFVSISMTTESVSTSDDVESEAGDGSLGR